MVYEKDETFIAECGQDLNEDRLVTRERTIIFFSNCRARDPKLSFQIDLPN